MCAEPERTGGERGSGDEPSTPPLNDGNAVKGILALTKEAYKDAPGWLKGFVFTTGLAAVIGLILSLCLVKAKSPGYALTAFLATLAVLALDAVLIYRIIAAGRDRRPSDGLSPSGPAPSQPAANPPAQKTVTWSRIVPKLPLPPDTEATLSTLLEEVRKGALAWLQEKEEQDVRDEKVRTNMFFAHYHPSAPARGTGFRLQMHEKLRKNMEYAREWELAFRPGQGATGKCFCHSEVQRSIRGDCPGEWEERYLLTESVKDLIHKDLKWVVSMPVLDPATEEACAVVNVDGLNHELAGSDLQDLAERLTPNMAAFAVKLSQCPRVQINITSSEVP